MDSQVGRTCFETQKEAQEEVIKKIKSKIENLQSDLADAEKELSDIEAMNNGEMRSVEVYFTDECDTAKVVDQLTKAGLVIALIHDGWVEGLTNDMSKLYIYGVSWITIKESK